MCFYHVVHANEKYLKPLTKGGKCGHIKDIQTLQHCDNEGTFAKASELFLKWWKKDKDPQVRTFITHFEDEWLHKYPKWFEGAAPGFPSTNNSLEATNGWIKRKHTSRSRLPVRQFLKNVYQLLEKWS